MDVEAVGKDILDCVYAIHSKFWDAITKRWNRKNRKQHLITSRTKANVA